MVYLSAERFLIECLRKNQKIFLNFVVFEMFAKKILNNLFLLTFLKMEHFSVSASSSTVTSKNVNPLNTKLIDRLVDNRVVSSLEVESVMRSIDRGDFTTYGAYEDR